MPQIRVTDPIASPFDDERAVVAFLADLATSQADDFIPEFAEVCGRCLSAVSAQGVCGCPRIAA